MLEKLLYQYEQDFFSMKFCRKKENLQKRLHKEFTEYGKSGKIFYREETITELSILTADRDIKIKEFQCTLLNAKTALVHYISVHNNKTKVLRTSIWKEETGNWQLYFHQGTEIKEAPKIIFDTERLYLREIVQEDYKDLTEILQGDEVVYAYEHQFSDKDVQEWLNRQIMRYRKYGFGLWVVILKETGEMVGQAGLTIQKCENEEVLEVGYLLKKKFWHKGYAFEAAEGCKKYAFEKLKAGKLYSIIKTDNLKSIAVAEKLGMSVEKTFEVKYYNGEALHFLYSIVNKS